MNAWYAGPIQPHSSAARRLAWMHRVERPPVGWKKGRRAVVGRPPLLRTMPGRRFPFRHPARALPTTVEIMTGRSPIENVTPSVSCGRSPAKAVVGELVPVAAVSYREGHNALGVNVVWRGPDGESEPFPRLMPGEPG